MDTDDIKLSGYVLRNREKELLTHRKGWRPEDETGGWIWSEEELKQIVQQAEIQWLVRPTYKQAAYLSRRTGITVITGNLEKI